MRKPFFMPLKNSHSQNCKDCGRNLKDKWWIQLGFNVFCEKHGRLRKNSLTK